MDVYPGDTGQDWRGAAHPNPPGAYGDPGARSARSNDVAAHSVRGWFRRQCDLAGLSRCSAHGLRKAASRRFAEHGFSDREIMSWTGHRSHREVGRYTRRRAEEGSPPRALRRSLSEHPFANLLPGLRTRAKNRDASMTENESGSPGRIRTIDQPVNSRLLYR